MLRLTAFCTVIATSPALAAEVRPCHAAETSALFLAEPWEANTRTFANGDVRLAILDMVEPAAAAFHLLILSPPFDTLGLPTCQVISFDGSTGYREMSLEGLTSSYDPATGLSFQVPMAVGPQPFDEGVLFFSLNQSTGAITAEDIGT